MGKIKMTCQQKHADSSKYSKEHNSREKVAKDVVVEAYSDYFKIIKNENIEDAYHDEFDEAVAEYNSRQIPKHLDRIIDDYYSQIKLNEDKHEHAKTMYESVFKVGRMEDYESGKIDRSTAMRMCEDYIQEWQQQNPQMRLFGAYIHGDEKGAVHLHYDYFPVATGYKKGLSKQVSMSRALKQQYDEQGIDLQGKQPTTVFAEREQALATEIYERYGYERVKSDDDYIEQDLYESTMQKADSDIFATKHQLDIQQQSVEIARRKNQRDKEAIEKYVDDEEARIEAMKAELEVERQNIEKTVQERTEAERQRLQSEFARREAQRQAEFNAHKQAVDNAMRANERTAERTVRQFGGNIGKFM